MLTPFSRTQLLLGEEAMAQLALAHVAVFGIGGVGSFAVEALARSGIGAIDIIDNDKVCLSNLNRQLYALHSTLGRDKVDVAAERIRDINPDCLVVPHKLFFLPETASRFDFSQYDYVVDCIDTVAGKIQLILQAKEAGVPVISCMGAGNKLDPSRFAIADISRTSVCPLARAMRQALRKRGIEHVKVLYSTEKPLKPLSDEAADSDAGSRRQVPGSTAFVPSVAGLMIAGEVIRELAGLYEPPLADDFESGAEWL